MERGRGAAGVVSSLGPLPLRLQTVSQGGARLWCTQLCARPRAGAGHPGEEDEAPATYGAIRGLFLRLTPRRLLGN